MTLAQLNRMVGRRVLLTMTRPDGLRVPVEILDARRSFGRVDFLVTPIGGKGKAWVSWESTSLQGRQP